MKKASLLRQMVAGVLVAELICAALLSGLAVVHEMRGRLRAFDVMLRGRADSVLGAIRDAEDPGDNAVVDPSELQVPDQDIYVVVDPSGRVLGQSPGLTEQLAKALRERATEPYFPFRSGGSRYRGVRLNGVRVIDRDDHGGIRRPVLILYASPSYPIWHESIEAVRFYVIGGIVLLGATGAALGWYLRRKLAPIEELAATAAGVSPQAWEFQPPAAARTTRELAPIADAIEHLLKGLRAAFERQRQLTGDAAHELKTSIAVLKSSLQLLTLTPRSATEYERGLEGLLLDIERTEELAARMLALARLEEAVAAEDETTNLSSAAASVVNRLRPIAELRRIGLSLVAEDDVAVPLASEDAEVLCSNLLMNALQHTPAGGHIELRIRAKGVSTVLHVVDDGEGIPEAALPHVFERFYRADSSRSRQSGGAGLGLAICKAMVERIHGSIDVQSTYGSGTEVVVRLPGCSQAAPSPLPPTQSADRSVSKGSL